MAWDSDLDNAPVGVPILLLFDLSDDRHVMTWAKANGSSNPVQVVVGKRVGDDAWEINSTPAVNNHSWNCGDVFLTAWSLIPEFPDQGMLCL